VSRFRSNRRNSAILPEEAKWTSGGVGSVLITGQFTHFAPGTTQVDFGSGITVGTVSVADEPTEPPG